MRHWGGARRANAGSPPRRIAGKTGSLGAAAGLRGRRRRRRAPEEARARGTSPSPTVGLNRFDARPSPLRLPGVGREGVSAVDSCGDAERHEAAAAQPLPANWCAPSATWVPYSPWLRLPCSTATLATGKRVPGGPPSHRDLTLAHAGEELECVEYAAAAFDSIMPEPRSRQAVRCRDLIRRS